jgi:hypothetical protein
MNPMRSLHVPLVVALLVGGAPVHAAPPAPAESTPDDATTKARQLVKVGTEEYGKQHWESAHEAFLKAWELKQHFAIAANLADVEMRLGRYREAAEHWKFTLANLPADRADRRSDAEKQLLECKTHLSVVRVTVSISGAEVRLDGNSVGASPLSEELWLEPGEHTIEAEHAGYSTASHRFAATEGESREVGLALEVLPQPGAAPAKQSGPVQQPAEEKSGLAPRTLVLIGGSALTLTAVGIGIGYTVAANSASEEADKLREGLPVGACVPAPPAQLPIVCTELAQKIDDRNTSTNIAVASFIAGGVFGAATTVLYLLWHDQDASGSRSGMILTPWTFDGGRGMQIIGRF